VTEERQENLVFIFDWATEVVLTAGVEGVAGVGVDSNIAEDPDPVVVPATLVPTPVLGVRGNS
jgi:hypothetical protein